LCETEGPSQLTSYPLTTAKGLSLATLRLTPAASITLTTSATSL
jgi:hypothetical protein